jgi:Ras-related protein Rab-6A
MASHLRFVVLGESFVGKTTLARKFSGESMDTDYQPTIGSDTFFATVELLGETHRVSIRDTAGQEKFNSLVPLYCYTAHAEILVYSATKCTSFSSLPKWIDYLRSAASDASVLVFGNKWIVEADIFAGKEALVQGKEFRARLKRLYRRDRNNDS